MLNCNVSVRKEQEAITPMRFKPGQGESWDDYGAGNNIPDKNCSWLTCPRSYFLLGTFSWDENLEKGFLGNFFQDESLG